MKMMLKRTGVFFLAICMMFALTACGEEREKEYKENFLAAVSEMKTVKAEFNAAADALFGGNSIREEDKQALLDAITKLREAYARFGSLEAPEKYQAVQSLFNEGIESAQKALEIYETEIGTLSDDTLNEEALERLQEGDKLIQQASDKIAEGAKMGVELDEK